MRHRFLLHSGLFAMSAAILTPQAAMADSGAEAAQAPSSNSSTADQGGLDEIIVTAQRKEESLQRVPISIAAVSGEQLVKTGITNMLNVTLRTPGVVISDQSGYAQVYIRGIGTPYANPGLESSTATYVDGMYVSAQIGSLFDLVDSSSIQVIKGPQGSLYGRNATGGAVLVNSNDPTDRMEGSLRAEFGNIDHRKTEGVLNLPVSDQLAFRFAGMYYKDGGYIKNLFDGKDMWGGEGWLVRGKALANPTDRLSILLTAEFSRRVEDLNVHKIISPAQCGGCLLASGQIYPPAGSYLTDENTQPPTTTKTSMITGKITYDLDSLKLTSLTGYRYQYWNGYYDIDNSISEYQNYYATQRIKNIQQEFQATSSFDGPFNFMLGAVYARYDAAWPKANIWGTAATGLTGAANTPESGLNAVIDTISNSYSAYGELYYNFTPQLKLTVGGRYTYEKKTMNGSSTFGGFPFDTFSGSQSYKAFTPRAVLAYETDVGNFYVSYNRGFKAGGINTPLFSQAQLNIVEPEKIDGIEGGAKLKFLNNRLRVNFAAFYDWYSNMQVSQTNLAAGGNITVNAASSRLWGLELGVDAEVLPGLQIGGEVNYLHARFSDYPGGQLYAPAPGYFCVLGLPAAGGGCEGIVASNVAPNLKGYALPNAPDWTVTMHLDYEKSIGEDRDAGFSISARYTSSYDFFVGGGSTLGLDSQRSTFIANASAFVDVMPRVRLGAFVNNLTNQFYVNIRSTAATGTFEIPARPRTYGGSLSVKF